MTSQCTCDVSADTLPCCCGPASQLQDELRAILPHSGTELRAAPSRTHIHLLDDLLEHMTLSFSCIQLPNQREKYVCCNILARHLLRLAALCIPAGILFLKKIMFTAPSRTCTNQTAPFQALKKTQKPS